MKQALLYPILDRVFDRIKSGSQCWLFARQEPKREFSRVLCAIRDPRPLVVLEATTGEPLHLEVSHLRRKCFKESGMQATEWAAYFFGVTHGVAIPLTAVAAIPPSSRFDPVKYFRLNQFPQKFCYVPAPAWALGRPILEVPKKPDMLF